MPTYTGKCVCNHITFECQGEPLFTQYCHCTKCRDVASLSHLEKDKIGYAFTAAYLQKNFKITTAKPKFEEVLRNNSKLFLCSNCKSLIYGIALDPRFQAAIGINANNFIFSTALPSSFNPVRHVFYVNRVIDFSDDLPKYKDAPQEQFGSGELIED